MRIILHNPHALWYKMTIGSFLNKTRPMDKYEYLFDYLYCDTRNKMYIYLDNSNYATLPKGILARLKTPIFKFYTWAFINKLNPCKFVIINDLEKLNSNDVLLTFLHINFTNLAGKFEIPRKPFLDNLRNTKALKVVNLSHYGYNTGLGSKNTREAEIDLFVSENNLSKNSSFFKYHYPWYRKDVYVLPFVPHKKFTKSCEFTKRKNKAFAIGTITFPMIDNDFINYFKDNKLQPMRQTIFNNSKKIEYYVDSFISHITENITSKNSNTDNLTRKSDGIKLNNYKKNIQQLISLILFPMRILAVILNKNKKVILGSSERQYYKFDIVSKYNEYKMFICPEEIIDLPGIGFVEGMACGTAFLGIRNPMYSDLGLIDKVHYIGYDGTLEDLIDKIKYYQNNQVELEEIADRGYKFVTENFNGEVVCKKYLEDLEKLCLTN